MELVKVRGRATMGLSDGSALGTEAGHCLVRNWVCQRDQKAYSNST
jgi:hypothetical protein